MTYSHYHIVTITTMMTITHLSTYILITIFTYLNIEDYLALNATCKRFQTVLNHHDIIPKQITEFQSAQRKLYQEVAFYIPRNNVWDLCGKLNYVCGILRTETLCYIGDRHCVKERDMFTDLQKPRDEWDLSAEYFHDYLILGHDRIARVYDDAMYKLANSNFTELNLSNNYVCSYGGDPCDTWQYLFQIMRRNPHNIKLKKLVLHGAYLNNLDQLYDIRDLFDNCELYLPNKRYYGTRRKHVITGVATVFISGSKFKKKKAQKIFRDNSGEPAVVWEYGEKLATPLNVCKK